MGKRRGRPAKSPERRAQGISVSLDAERARALEDLLRTLNAELPSPVPRSDVVQLAISLLLKWKPNAVRDALIEEAKKQRSL